MKQFYLTGIGPDSPGIVAAITEVLNRFGSNIEDTSMTILAQQFALLMIISLESGQNPTDLQAALTEASHRLGFNLNITPAEEMKPGENGVLKNNTDEAYMISVAGQDKTGITYESTRILAQYGVNITDLNAQRILGEGGQPVYIMMIECTIPTTIDLPAFERELAMMGERLTVEVTYHPIEAIAL